MRTIQTSAVLDLPTMLIDTDEVLGNFHAPVLLVMEKVTGRPQRISDFKTWDIFEGLTPQEQEAVFTQVQKPGFCTSIEPAPGAIDAVRELRQIVDLHVVTSPFKGASTWAHERSQWLEDFFGFTYDDITHTRAKYNVYGDALLDDRPSNVTRWAEKHPGGDAMLWHTPNTATLHYDHLRVRSWGEVIERAKRLRVRGTPCVRCTSGEQPGKGSK